jgi:hypothetical protein
MGGSDDEEIDVKIFPDKLISIPKPWTGEKAPSELHTETDVSGNTNYYSAVMDESTLSQLCLMMR